MTEQFVVAFDGSSPSQAALRYTLEHNPDGDVTALFVVPEAGGGTDGSKLPAVPEFLDGVDRERMELGELVAETARELAAELGRRIDTRVESGVPGRTIAAVGEERDVDHVVVGDSVSGANPAPVVGTVVRDCPTTGTIVRTDQAPGEQ